ncbi:MAG: hypothetical protein OXD49_14330 [Candidatus Poribacteria bacterium]|nr:hypothetical protein [Candidatus Poribacteria bacterium]
MNLVKQEEEAKEFPTSQIIHQISGILVAASIGDLTGISAAVVPVITQWGLERFITPLMSERQSARLLQWAQQAAEGIAQRLANGEKYREDGFFDEIPTGRSKMDEVVESTLKKVMETTEEPKIKFMANLTENVHFDSDIDIDTYRRLLNYLEELTYRQLCIVKLFANANQIDLDNFGHPNITQNLSSILTDCFEVRDKGFINSGNPLMEKISELYLGSSGNTWTDGGKPPEYPGFANPAGFSNTLSENMLKFAKLDQIPDEHVEEILSQLKPRSTEAS